MQEAISLNRKGRLLHSQRPLIDFLLLQLDLQAFEPLVFEIVSQRTAKAFKMSLILLR